MSEFFNPKYSDLVAYTPGEQPQDKKYIKLNTNESPFGASDAVVKALTEEKIKNLRLYCDPECKLLKEAIAKKYDCQPQNVFVTNGSDDILNFSFMAFGQNGAAFCDITYGFYSVFAKLHGVESEIIPLKEDFSIDVNKFYSKGKMVVIANPNAPTGIYLTLEEIEKIVESNKENVVIIDEAYIDFGGESCAKLTKKYKNLLCVQTFSKSRSMAGARLGFAIADESIIRDLETIKYSTNPYNVNSLTQAAGIAAVEDEEYFETNRNTVIKNRDFTVEELKKLGFTVLPSKANFVFAKHERIGGKEIYLKLKEKGVLVRHFETERISDYNRITIGSLSEMKTFISKIKEILGEN